jgi:hypothetical protein
MISILGIGGYGTVPHTATPAAPAVLMDDVVEGSASQTYSIYNHDATNWLWISINNMHPSAAALVLPGERRYFIKGFNGNSIQKMVAWTTVINTNWNGSQASADIAVSGDRTRFI